MLQCVIPTTENNMAKKQGRSGHSAEDSSQFEAFGDWPTINLTLIDASGKFDYGYDPRSRKERDDSASRSGPVEGKRTGIFEFHTQFTLDQKTIDDVRVELAKGTKDGRREAYAILKNHPQFKIGGSAGKKMVKAALQATLFS